MYVHAISARVPLSALSGLAISSNFAGGLGNFSKHGRRGCARQRQQQPPPLQGPPAPGNIWLRC